MLASKRKKTGGGGWLLFWLAFFIGVALLFMMNLERIRGTLQETRILDRLTGNETVDGDAPELDHLIQELAIQAETETKASEPAGAAGQVPAEQPVVTITQAESAVPNKPGTDGTARQGGGNPAVPPVENKTVDRTVYLMKVDNTGAILWTRVKRNLPASNNPLRDTLEALIRGPSTDEEKQGLMSLIPKDVVIQNAVVRDSTAYVSFSENFLFNTYGVEGYASQRRQIVLTATEFSNVKDIQILIDGKRVDYLGESIWIGSPVNRNML